MLGKVKQYIVPLVVMLAIFIGSVASANTAHASSRTWDTGCMRAHQYVSAPNYRWAATSRLNNNCTTLSVSIWRNTGLLGDAPSGTCLSLYQVTVATDPVYAQTSYSGSIVGPCSAHTSGGMLYNSARKFLSS